MSKADTLGASSAFASAAGAISARRMVTQQALGQPAAEMPVTEAPVSDISLNPANPRSELGDLTDLAGSLRDHGQKTAISIMSRDAYLEAHPDRAADLEPGARFVAIDGNSRLAAAREAGLKTIKVMLDDDLGRNADDLLESALVANIHRKNFDPLDEARALQQLLTIHGTQEALAARLHRSQGWVAQRLALLGLTPALQKRLEDGEESVDMLRRVGRKKPEEQEQILQRLKDEEARKKAAAKAARKRPPGPAVAADDGTHGSSHDEVQTQPPHYGVIKHPPHAAEAGTEPTAPAASGESGPLPVQRAQVQPGAALGTGLEALDTEDPLPKPPIRMPWENGLRTAEIVIEKMARDQMTILYERLGEELAK